MHIEVRCHNRGAGQEQLPLHPRQQPLQPEVLLRPLALVSSPSPPPTEALAMFANQGTSYPRHPLFAWSLSQTPLRISATVPMQLKLLNATHAMTLIFTLNLSRLFVDFHFKFSQVGISSSLLCPWCRLQSRQNDRPRLFQVTLNFNCQKP